MGLAVYNACTTTRIVCRPNCPPGRRTLPAHRVTFATLEEARAAGYRPCRVCTPDEGPPGPWASKAQQRRAAQGMAGGSGANGSGERTQG